MSTFSQAIPNKDFISLFKMVSPAEASLLTGSADEISSSNSSDSGGKSKSEPGAMFSKDAIDSYLDSLNINASEMVYSVDQKSNGLAVASISSWTLDVTINQSLADTLRMRYEAAKANSLTDKENDFFSSLDFSEARYSGEVTESFFSDHPLEVVLVKEGGRWYISPTMTLAQWEYQRRALWDDRTASPNYEADFATARGAESPEAAVEEVIDTALNARRPSDMFDDSVTGLLALPERRLAMVYGSTLVGDDNAYYQRESARVQINWGLTSTDIGNNRSVVHPGTSTVTISTANEDEMVTWSFRDGSVDISLPSSENDTVTVDFTRQLANPNQLGIVVEKNGGTWHVSSLATVVNFFKLRPSDRAINGLYDLFTDAGMDPDNADGLTDVLSQSTAIATPLVVILDIVSQLQDVEWGARYDDNEYGSGAYLDEYYNQCTAGDMAACDSLYYASSLGSDAGEYGQTCGDRDYSLWSGGMCESTHGSWYY
ncbi:hypothetical protein [Actinomyces qiguomingii]|nr:hypothetical protein [Actinomyces qiguomingii]